MKKSAETRKKMSEARKKFWERKTPEQKSAIALKGTNTRETSGTENKRRETISKRMKDFYVTPEGKQATQAGITTYKKVREARSPERIAELSKQKSDTTKRVWGNLTVEQRADRSEKVNGSFKKIRFEGKNENIIRADSKWERGVYKLLQKLEIPFLFSNEDKGCWFQLGSESEPRLMFPDFILENHLIIEVKGYGPAWDKLVWQIPEFIKRYGDKYSYAICLFNPEDRPEYKSFDDFLKDLNWVHITPEHEKKWKYPCHLAEKLASNNRAISVDSVTQKGWLLKEARGIPR